MIRVAGLLLLGALLALSPNARAETDFNVRYGVDVLLPTFHSDTSLKPHQYVRPAFSGGLGRRFGEEAFGVRLRFGPGLTSMFVRSRLFIPDLAMYYRHTFTTRGMTRPFIGCTAGLTYLERRRVQEFDARVLGLNSSLDAGLSIQLHPKMAALIGLELWTVLVTDDVRESFVGPGLFVGVLY